VNTLAVRRAAGAVLVVVPVAFTVCFTLLQQLFEYPDILAVARSKERAASMRKKAAELGVPTRPSAGR
jgi:hypothetical protein